VAAILLTASLGLAACGSSGGGGPTACQRIGVQLKKGPNPESDPYGYAISQVLPLQQMPISHPGLQIAVRALSHAFLVYYQTSGKDTASDNLTKAKRRVDHYCHGLIPLG
jgi:hypothetical protein